MPVIGNYQFGEPENFGFANFQQGNIGNIQSFQSGGNRFRPFEMPPNFGNNLFNQPSIFQFNGNDP
jgi:hypothetical protein